MNLKYNTNVIIYETETDSDIESRFVVVKRGVYICVCIYIQIIILNEVSQRKKDKYHMISLMGRIFKKDTNELICKTKTNLTDLENELEGLE